MSNELPVDGGGDRISLGRFQLMIAVVAMIAAPAVTWGIYSSRIETNVKRIDTLEAAQKWQSEMLWRIDENVKELKVRRTP